MLLDYGLRSQAFMNAYLRAIASGDAMMLARILNPDDVDFPIETAREIVLRYRAPAGMRSRDYVASRHGTRNDFRSSRRSRASRCFATAW
jgi:hypothetical protein